MTLIYEGSAENKGEAGKTRTRNIRRQHVMNVPKKRTGAVNSHVPRPRAPRCRGAAI